MYVYKVVIVSFRYDKENIIGCILADHAGLCLGGNESLQIQMRKLLTLWGSCNVKFMHDKNNYKWTFAVKGDASSDSAGLIAAIADLVAKLEPKSESPIISLQNDNR